MNRPNPFFSRSRPWALPASIILGLTLVFILLLALHPATSSATQPVQVGLIVDEAGLNDMGFNWLAYQGLLRAESELGAVGTVYTSTGTISPGQNVQQCVDDGNALCIGTGFLAREAISVAAKMSPGTLFAILDITYPSYPDNLRGTTFAADQAGYLAGALAGLMSESGVVGAVGGMEIPPVAAFAEPYRYGSQCARPDVTAIVTYTGSFVQPLLGAQVAQAQMAQGADVIFGVGAATGNGAVLTAAQSGAWAIGVDVDQYLTLFEGGTVTGSEKLLSSAMKRLDSAVYDTIADVGAGTFTSGTVLYDLAQDGVGLAPFHEADGAVPTAVREELDRIRQGIISGTIDVNAPCTGHTIFLPVALRNG
jgi:basic membrane protein A